MSYLFRREDDGSLVEVDWATMMQQKGGFITLPDGVEARRCTHLEPKLTKAQKRKKVQADIVSDALGVSSYAAAEYQKDADKHGLAVEFVQDPTSPYFKQAKFSSWAEKDRYLRHRGLCDNNSRNGGGTPLGTELLKRAVDLVMRQSSSQ